MTSGSTYSGTPRREPIGRQAAQLEIGQVPLDLLLGRQVCVLVPHGLGSELHVEPPIPGDHCQGATFGYVEKERLHHFIGLDAERPCLIDGRERLGVRDRLEGHALPLQVLGRH
jgi:hypothetical protein